MPQSSVMSLMVILFSGFCRSSFFREFSSAYLVNWGITVSFLTGEGCHFLSQSNPRKTGTPV